MLDQLLEKLEHFGILDDFDFVEQDGKGQGAADHELQQVLGTGRIVALRLPGGHGQQAEALVQQVDETLQVVVGGLQVDPQRSLAAGQAVLAILLHERGFTETCGCTNQDQAGRIGVGHLLKQARTRQVAVGRFGTGELDRATSRG
ncbi:hypothetical protein D3C76_559280 [compost metagenome]